MPSGSLPSSTSDLLCDLPGGDRTTPWSWGARRSWAWVTALVASLLVLTAAAPAAPAVPSVVGAAGTAARSAPAAPVLSELDGTEDDLGARSLRGDSWSTPVVEPEDITRFAPIFPMTPPWDELYRSPDYYADGCHVGRNGTTVVPGCRYGVADSDVTVAVIGNSKVGQYFPALEEIALREGWALRMYTKSACDFVKDAPPTPNYPQCDSYNNALRKHLQSNPPDRVITGGQRANVADGYVSAWEFLEELGVEQIAALWDTPVPPNTPDTCIAGLLQSGEDLTGCAQELPDARSANGSLREAASRVDSATFVNLRDWVCPATALWPNCAVVVGRSQIYANGSHMAQAYAGTLTDPLHQRLHEAGLAHHRPSVDRVAGQDRYETAALLSRDVTPGGRVFVSSGTDFPDALAAAAKAGHTEGAVLLTRPGSLPVVTRQALQRLQPSQVVVTGGKEAVSEEVLQQLRTLSPNVQRVQGQNRYETAAAVSGLAPATPGGTVYVATGTDFADALAAAAQAGQRDAAILLVQPDRIPVVTAQALSDLGPSTIIVAGGSGAVSDTVFAELDELAPVVERRAGPNRYATAAALAQDMPRGSVLHVAVGTQFADSLAAAPASAAAGGAVLLVSADRVQWPTAQAIEDLRPSGVVLAGGRSAVSEDVKRALIRLVP